MGGDKGLVQVVPTDHQSVEEESGLMNQLTERVLERNRESCTQEEERRKTVEWWYPSNFN